MLRRETLRSNENINGGSSPQISCDSPGHILPRTNLHPAETVVQISAADPFTGMFPHGFPVTDVYRASTLGQL